MQTQRSFTEELKFQYTHGGAHIRLIFINTAVFLVVGILHMSERLAGYPGGPVSQVLDHIFLLPGTFGEVLTHPWTLVTSIFAHYDFMHFLLNMLFLFISGRMFLQFFSASRLMHLYVVGGMVGCLFQVFAQLAFMNVSPAPTLGASGAVMAIFIALAFYRPGLQIALFGVFNVPLIVLAGIYLISDFLNLGANDNTAHFAHIGGALAGVLSVRNMHAQGNIINMSEKLMQSMRSFFNALVKPKSRLRAEKGGRVKTDEQYNAEARSRQKRIDAILDKISKSGYESLTKAEKEFLFSQSNKR
jgi:membrane associated rhomboid family serine protease